MSHPGYAAALLADLAAVRVFAARDKRTAFLCTVALIEANGYSCAMPDSEAIADGVRDVAGHRFWRKRAWSYRIDLPASERTDHGKASADYQ